jgi:hypothetical protein
MGEATQRGWLCFFRTVAILRAAVRILHFSVHIWILLGKSVQIQVEPFKMEVAKI